jgi:hypothetical protein
MVFQKNAPAASEGSAQVPAELRPELRTAGSGGVRHPVPDADARGLERRGIDRLLAHFLQRSFESIF